MNVRVCHRAWAFAAALGAGLLLGRSAAAHPNSPEARAESALTPWAERPVDERDAGWAGLPLKREPVGEGRKDGRLATVLVGSLIALGLTLGVVQRWRASNIAAGGRLHSLLARLGSTAHAPSGDELEVRQSMRLTQDANLHVVVWKGKELLVGSTSHGLRVLARVTSPEGKAEGDGA